MNALDRGALLWDVSLYEQDAVGVDERTLAIVDRRRQTAVVRRRGWLVRRALAFADALGLTLAFLAAELALGSGEADRLRFRDEILLFVTTLPAWILLARLHGLYDRDEERSDHSTADDVVGVFHLVTIGAWLLVVGSWLTGAADPQIAKLATFWALAVLLVPLCRSGARAFARTRMTYLQNTLIVGTGQIGQLLARKYLRHPEYGINLVGFVDATPSERPLDLAQLPLLGPPERLAAIVRLLDIERVVIAFSMDADAQHLDLIRSLRHLDVQVDVVPRLFELVSPNVAIHTVEGFPLVGLLPPRLSRSSRLLKRALDIAVSSAALVLLAPLFLLLAVLIKVESPGPVFFRQVRMGAGERPFRIYKFRTMVGDAESRKAEVAHLNMHAHDGGDPRMFKIANDPRVTRIGRFMRRYSLDELPQLINVLRNEMSLVGPRPLVLDEDRHVDAWARRRLDPKPGMTGLWQVLGRSEIPFGEMINLDYRYVTTWSLAGDLRLLCRTIPLVLRGSGAPY